jgi:hypothetical protein
MGEGREISRKNAGSMCRRYWFKSNFCHVSRKRDAIRVGGKKPARGGSGGLKRKTSIRELLVPVPNSELT